MLSDFKPQIVELIEKCDEYKQYKRLIESRQQLALLEEMSKKENFWDDQEAAGKTLKQISSLKNFITPWDSFFKEVEDLEVLYDMAIEENAAEYEEEIQEIIKKQTKELENLEFMELLSGENDNADAILQIHAGAGGTEACDWGDMLYRMYNRWAERHNFEVEIIDWLDGDGAGIKSVSMLIKGDFAFGYLQYETGIHRLVRISPFDSNARRHTSFASVFVSPDIEDTIEVEIKPEELRIDTYRAGGAGGQHVNKTDSAVRMTHLPTGIVVQCQNERSQLKNRATAMKVLKARLYNHYKKEQDEKTDKNSPEKKEIGWGSQIRSYVFQPYTMVKDHRTKAETGNIHAVMDGDLDEFITEELKTFNVKNK